MTYKNVFERLPKSFEKLSEPKIYVDCTKLLVPVVLEQLIKPKYIDDTCISENLNMDGKSSESIERVPYGSVIQSLTFEDLERILSNLEEISKNQKDENKYIDRKNPPKKLLTFDVVEQRLIEVLANVQRVNYQGKSQEELNSELLKAAQNGETQSVNSLIEAGAHVATKNASGDSALHLGAVKGHDDVVEVILNQGLDVDTRGSSKGSTVKLLLDRGARLELRNKADETAFQMILDKQMLITREFIIDRMIDEISENCYNEALEEYKIIQKIKSMLPSSVGLRDSIRSVRDRFKWGLGMFWFMLVRSFILEVILGTSLYFLDIYTDLQFTFYLFGQSERNFTAEIEKCTPEFHTSFAMTKKSCESGANFDPNSCLELVRSLKLKADECFVSDMRFEKSSDWNIVGIISACHCALPFIVSIITWMFCSNWRLCNRRSLLKFPLPFVTKMYQFHYTTKLFKCYTKDRRGEEDRSNFELSRGKLMSKIRNYEAAVNFSVLIEAAIESSFQFWLQINFLISTVIITITDGLVNWKDLLNWRLASICISLGTFSFACYNIK